MIPAITAAMARTLSIPPTVEAWAAGRLTGRCAEGAAAAGAAGFCATGAAEARGASAGAGVGAGVGDMGAGAAPVGPPGGSVGNLIVGAAEGFGGRLMRTVSFLG
jgi:hypothetical protein